MIDLALSPASLIVAPDVTELRFDWAGDELMGAARRRFAELREILQAMRADREFSYCEEVQEEIRQLTLLAPTETEKVFFRITEAAQAYFDGYPPPRHLTAIGDGPPPSLDRGERAFSLPVVMTRRLIPQGAFGRRWRISQWLAPLASEVRDVLNRSFVGWAAYRVLPVPIYEGFHQRLNLFGYPVRVYMTYHHLSGSFILSASISLAGAKPTPEVWDAEEIEQVEWDDDDSE